MGSVNNAPHDCLTYKMGNTMKIYLVSAINGAHHMDAKFYGENFSDVEKQFTDIHTDWVITEIRLVGFTHDGVTYKF